jgi:hypothetical protein
MKSLITAIAIVLFIVGIVFAATENSLVSPVPHLINYQGMLTQSDGITPVPNGTYSILFRIYDAATVGTLMWDHTYSVTVTNGLFNVILGTSEPIDLAFDEPYWLEIKVGADPVLSPRTQLTSVGYAYTSEYAVSAGSAPTGGGWVDAGTKVRLETSTDSVGIGTSTPAYKLDVAGSLNLNKGIASGIALRVNGAEALWYDGTYFSWGFGGTANYFADSVGIGTTNPGQKLSVIGDVGVGSSSTTGSLKVYMSGSANPIVRAENYSTNGGKVDLFDEAGNCTHYIEADQDGSGGFFEVMRSASAYGFKVDGNYSGTNEPRVEITGSSQGAYFRMDQSGNGSVLLPTDAISRGEILDEPGVASNKEGSAGVTLDGTVQTLLSRTITCPASGYVLVIGTAQANVFQTYGTVSTADFGVSASSSSFPVNQEVALYFDDALATGTYIIPTTVHGLFTVSAGSNTFYFLAQENSGNYSVNDMQLTLVYLPTAYGTVVATKIEGESNIPDEQAPKVSSMSPSDIEAEKAESEAFNAARIDKELAEIRAQIEALKAEMGKQQGEQNK